MNNDNQEQLGGTTNLSLEQLKQEGGPTSPTGLSDQDDVNEIKAADDLDEPDAEEFDNADLTDNEEQPEGDDNEAANPAELNS